MLPQIEIFSNGYCTLHTVPLIKAVVCTAISEYIPIDDFKSIFHSAEDFCEQENVRAFIFDKRNLRTFHQPSMEWYFTEWKPVMKAKGMNIHYKILPEMEWFRQSVAAGRAEIVSKHSKDFLTGITIKYVDELEEAFSDLKKLT